MVLVEDPIDSTAMLKKIEHFTRKCYKSEGKATENSAPEFVGRIFNTMKHEGIIEHRFVSVTFITDRGVSHESVRHRMAAYLQESTRYCDYSNKGVTFILPPWVKSSMPFATGDVSAGELYGKYIEWVQFKESCTQLEQVYQSYRARGWKPQQARYFLPNGIKTEYVATLNLGSWFNFFRKRTPDAAHPQMRQLAVPLLRYFQFHLPTIFGSIPLPTLDYEEAVLLEHPGTDAVEFAEVS